MTTTKQLKPKPIRKVSTPVLPDEEPKVIITKQCDFIHKEPVIIPSHLDDVPVISAASYIKDARNRWYIHNVEVKELYEFHVAIFNKIKPHAISTCNYLTDKVKDLRR